MAHHIFQLESSRCLISPDYRFLARVPDGCLWPGHCGTNIGGSNVELHLETPAGSASRPARPRRHASLERKVFAMSALSCGVDIGSTNIKVTLVDDRALPRFSGGQCNDGRFSGRFWRAGRLRTSLLFGLSCRRSRKYWLVVGSGGTPPRLSLITSGGCEWRCPDTRTVTPLVTALASTDFSSTRLVDLK
jgi:hypothetical protein